MPSLSDKLKALGVNIGAQNLPQPAEKLTHQVGATKLEETLSGHFLKNSQGRTFVVDTHYPLDYHQGKVGLLTSARLKMLSEWVGDQKIADMSPESFAFLDTETTGLSGGTGTYAFLIGAARFESDEFHLAQFFMNDPADEPALLLGLEEFLAPCQSIVTFNGKSFDAPLINTRFITHGWKTPLLDMVHVDLLHLARRLWRGRLPSRTLGNLEVQILGSERTEEDIPGWAIPQMYFDYIRSGDPEPLKSVFYHNAMDVVSLAALFNHTAGLLAEPLDIPLQHGIDLIALARLYEDLGELDTAIQLYIQGLAYEDQQDSQIAPEFRLSQEALLDAIERLALIHKRQDNYEAAIPLWEKAAQAEHLGAHIELAKFYEHRMRNYGEAMHWAESALGIVNTPGFRRSERLLWLENLENRIARLKRKLEKNNQT